MFHRLTFVFLSLALLTCTANQTNANLIGWNIGETAPDFSANYLSGGSAATTTWYSELGTGADAYVISTCAMWCAPCQTFASDSATIESQMASEGIQVEIYDWIFENPGFQEPSAADAQVWIDNFWTSNPENVWFGGDIPVSAPNSVILDIVTTYNSNAVPNILVLDRNLRVTHHFEGYFPDDLNNAIRSAAVPEPGALGIFGVVAVGCLCSRRRTH